MPWSDEKEAELRNSGWSDAEIRDYRRGYEGAAERSDGSRMSVPAASFDPRPAADADAPGLVVSYRGQGVPAEYADPGENDLELRFNTAGGSFRAAVEPLPSKEEQRAAARRATEAADETDLARSQWPDLAAAWDASGCAASNRTARIAMTKVAEQRAVSRRSVVQLGTGEDVVIEQRGTATMVSGTCDGIARYMREARPSFLPWRVISEAPPPVPVLEPLAAQRRPG